MKPNLDLESMVTKKHKHSVLKITEKISLFNIANDAFGI